jgi:hypothetical protein
MVRRVDDSVPVTDREREVVAGTAPSKPPGPLNHPAEDATMGW